MAGERVKKRTKLVKSTVPGEPDKEEVEVELPPLEEDEQEVGLQMIAEMMPYRDTPISEVFPWICWVCKCFSGKKEQTEAEQKKEKKRNADIAEQDGRLDKVIKDCKGKPYKGTDYQKDAKDTINETEGVFD